MKLNPKWKFAAMSSGEDFWHFFTHFPEQVTTCWIPIDGEMQRIPTQLLVMPKVSDWTKSLHIITEDGEFEPYVDVPGDGEKVMVRQYKEWVRRISAGVVNKGNLFCYIEGQCKWTSHGCTRDWAEWRRPTEEEMK